MQRGQTIRLVVAAVWLLPATALATPPFYDPGTYCRQVVRGGGTEQTFGACYREEQDAYDRIKLYWDRLTLRLRSYCGGMAESGGSSYQILEACLQQQGIVTKDVESQPAR